MLRITHTCSDDTAAIAVEGLARTVRMLHLTDLHLLHYDEREGARTSACRSFCARFAENERDDAGNPYDPTRAFEQVLADAATMDLDLLALTGDIVHYPSLAVIDYLASRIQAFGVPTIYTCGNHDVHFTDEPVNHERRQAWLPRLAPLHAESPEYEARDIGGIRFVAFDSFDCQVSAAQLDFVRRQLADGMPTVLLTHWPVSLPTLRDPTIAVMKAPVLIGDPDWSADSRLEWQVTADTPETIEFVRLATTAPNLVGVFCGHVHFAHADAMGPRALQYTGKPAFEGGRRLVEFRAA